MFNFTPKIDQSTQYGKVDQIQAIKKFGSVTFYMNKF